MKNYKFSIFWKNFERIIKNKIVMGYTFNSTGGLNRLIHNFNPGGRSDIVSNKVINNKDKLKKLNLYVSTKILLMNK